MLLSAQERDVIVLAPTKTKALFLTELKSTFQLGPYGPEKQYNQN